MMHVQVYLESLVNEGINDSKLINISFFCMCLQSNGDLKRKWTWAVEWLGDELERRPYTGNAQYTYNNWSPPVQSNETSNGYFLERSHSARMTLAKACELCPEEVWVMHTVHANP